MGTARWNDLAANLRGAIQTGKLRPGDKLPTETVLAENYRVCRMTAHRALSELQREGLVERRRRVGTVVLAPAVTEESATATKNVGLLFFHTNDFPQVEYVHGFRAGLPDDHHLLFCDSRNIAERESHYLRLLADADAVCCYPTGDKETTRLLHELAESGKPVLCLDRVPHDLCNVHAITTDNYQSALDGMRYLTQIRGHKRVAFLTTDRLYLSSVRERRDAFLHAMKEAGQTDAADTLIRTFPPGAGYDFDAFARSVQAVLAQLQGASDPPTALFCLEDYFLAAALEACDALGILIPGDMEILSFSDCPPLAARLTRTVHRISQQAFTMGEMAAQTLARLLQGEQITPQTIRVPAVLHPAAFANSPNSPAQRSNR